MKKSGSSKSRVITMRDVAARAGVSVMTVSLALKNSPRVSQERRKVIQALVKKMGYHINPLVSRLLSELPRHSGRQYHETLAYVTAYRSQQSLQDPYLVKLEKGLQERGRELGYQVETFNVGPEQGPTKRLQEILKARGIRGIVIAPFRDEVKHLSWDYRNFACVAASKRFTKPAIDCVVPNHYANMFQSVRNMLRLGYQRIGLAVKRVALVRNEFRWMGAYAAALLEREPSGPILIHELAEDGFKSFARWIQTSKVDAVISPNEFVFDWIEKMGLSIPRDMGFVAPSCGENEFSRPVSGINERAYDVGSAACDLLVARLIRNEIGVPDLQKILVVPGTWSGNSTLKTQP